MFLHAVQPGPASRSYGLAVAQLAGVPREVITRARRYLGELEAQAARHAALAAGPQAELPFGPSSATEAVTDLPSASVPGAAAAATAAADPAALQLRERLRAVDPDALSPRAALDLVYELRRLARD